MAKSKKGDEEVTRDEEEQATKTSSEEGQFSEGQDSSKDEPAAKEEKKTNKAAAGRAPEYRWFSGEIAAGFKPVTEVPTELRACRQFKEGLTLGVR